MNENVRSWLVVALVCAALALIITVLSAYNFKADCEHHGGTYSMSHGFTARCHF